MVRFFRNCFERKENILKPLLGLVLTLAAGVDSLCCTSIIISARANGGRPVMLKHRDSDCVDNRMAFFTGPRYTFIGLVNSSSEGGEVWTGTNSAGFSIMNTATYDLKDDDVPSSEMDREGILMFEVLGTCATLRDFENYLDTLPKPWGVEANFGVIDAHGGAAFYEVNNHSCTKFDVNETPGGCRIVTNFTQTGRIADRKGVDRYEKALEIYSGRPLSSWTPSDLLHAFSRSGKPILREITTSAVAIRGVEAGGRPEHSEMWVLLGYPAATVAVPLFVSDHDNIPSFLKSSASSRNAQLCDRSLVLKDLISKGSLAQEECISRCEQVESSVPFERLIERRRKGRLSDSAFHDRLLKYSDRIYRRFEREFHRYAGKGNRSVVDSDLND